MSKKLFVCLSVIFIAALGIYQLFPKASKFPIVAYNDGEEKEEFVKARLEYEFNMLKDPHTGEIPRDIRRKELDFAKSLPVKNFINPDISTPQNLNAYLPAGPDNIGGRTRAMAIDKRYGTGLNRVILSGSVSGGIFRTTDGGLSWTKVNPENDIHNVTSIAQDPRPGFQDTWYAGGGEAIGNSTSDIGAFYLGFGILKSTDNGVSWTKLPLSVTNFDGSNLAPGTLEIFDNVFDIVHQITVSPANGNVYIAAHRRLVRSTDGGQTFRVVFGSNVAATADAGQMDIITNSSGRLYLAVNGGNPDQTLRGVWTSTTGDYNSWTHIAGGKTPGVDSLSGWRGNAYDTAGPKRILIALAPSQQNLLFAFYENGLSQNASKGAHPEADLFRINTSNNSFVNLSANMPDFPGQADGIDPLALQGGYDMMVAVKPDDPNVVFVGGTNLYRSTDGFTTNTKTEWIGGYKKQNPINSETYPSSHADFHGLHFEPANPNHAYALNDGGIQRSDTILSNYSPLPVYWNMATRYQTLQYNYVAIDPAPGQNNFIGGAQDNGAYFRVGDIPTPNFQFKVGSGDGGSASIATVTDNSFTVYFSSQFGNITRDITNNFTEITPTGLTANPDGGFGDFVTYFKGDFDNPQDLYYVNFNRIFRTLAAANVTSATWQELTGIGNAVNPGNSSGTNISIRSLELSRGPYTTDHTLYIGTIDGKIFRLDDPRNAPVASTPVNISPPGLDGNVADIAVNPNNDNEIMAVVSNYGTVNIWYSANAKSATPTWKNAEGNLTLPSIRSCAIITKKNNGGQAVTEYYVGTSVGLYSTLNINAGSVNWEREGNSVLGLAVVVSLDYRPQDNTLLVGTHGNGMYYTTIGSPNYNPNGMGQPPTTDPGAFVQAAYPSPASTDLFYTVGTLTSVGSITVKVYAANGQLVFTESRGYQSGSVDLRRMARGVYILSIGTTDGSQQFTRKFVKN